MYYEVKYLVPLHRLRPLESWLSSRYGHSDPFDNGVVDTLYFDTHLGDSYNQCNTGEYIKKKYRLRGYQGKGYNQFQIKKKLGYQVEKEIYRLNKSISVDEKIPADWNFLDEDRIRLMAGLRSPLHEKIRVSYWRRRFRTKDIRLTLDEDISFAAANTGFPYVRSSAKLPFAVLEIKSSNSAKTIPECNSWNLELTSFSKFYLGEGLLRGRTDILLKYM